MKYLKWIPFEIKGWLIVYKMSILIFISDILMKQKDKKILKTKFGKWFIDYYGDHIQTLCKYMTYGDESGLQLISNAFYIKLNNLRLYLI